MADLKRQVDIPSTIFEAMASQGMVDTNALTPTPHKSFWKSLTQGPAVKIKPQADKNTK